MKEEFKPRIPNWMAGLMIGTAIFFVLLQWLLAWILMGWLVVIFSYCTFLLWYKIRGVTFLDRFVWRKLMSWVISFFFSLISNGVIPGILLGVLGTISAVKMEDKLVEKKVVTREELALLNTVAIKLFHTHGGDSPEFMHALALALGKRIEERYEDKKTELKDKAKSRFKNSSAYKRGLTASEYAQKAQDAYPVENKKAA
jgi:hypothetical protein